MSTEVVVQRTPEEIAVEINTIRNQTKMIMLQSSVEIGRRLVEAKEQLQHGEWGKWLEESVDYSHSTANNLMSLYKEYGDKIATIGNLNVASLPYTKAMALLGVPAEDREQFVQEHDVDNMSANQIKQAIKAQEEAESRAKEAEEAAEQQRLEAERERVAREALEKQSNENATEIMRLKEQLDEAKSSGNADDVTRLQRSLEESENELIDSRNKIKVLERKLKEKPIEVPAVVEVEKVPPEIEAELEELRKQAAKHSNHQSIVKFEISFSSLVGGFQNLLSALAEIPEADREKYKSAVVGLIGKMGEKL